MLFERKFSGKMSVERYAGSLGTKAKENAFNIFDYFFKNCQKHNGDSISHVERPINGLGEDPTKITITNASIYTNKKCHSIVTNANK